MRQLSRLQSVVMLLGALMMVVGAGLYVVGVQTASPIVFAVGAVAFASMQMMQTYEGQNIVLKRLRRIMTFADVLFIVSAVLMLENTYRLLLPFFIKTFENGYYLYLNYIFNNWVVTLLVAAVLEIYTTHRISNELKKNEE